MTTEVGWKCVWRRAVKPGGCPPGFQRPLSSRDLVPGFDLRPERKARFVAAERARGRRGITGDALADDTGPLRGVVPGRNGPEEPEHRTGEVGAAGARGDHDGRRYRGLEETAGVGVPAAAGIVLGRDARVPALHLFRLMLVFRVPSKRFFVSWYVNTNPPEMLGVGWYTRCSTMRHCLVS